MNSLYIGVILTFAAFVLGIIAFMIQRGIVRADKKSDRMADKLDTINTSVTILTGKHETMLEKITHTGKELEHTKLRVGKIEQELNKIK